METSSSSSGKLSSICVRSGSRLGINKDFQVAANKLDNVLVKKRINLVYEGTALCLMGNVALTSSFEGTGILGMILTPLKQFFTNSMGKEVEIASIQDRVPKMLEHSDPFIDLPSGLGTLDDIFHIVYWVSLSIHSNPLGLLNVNGYFDGLLTFLDHAVQEGFMDETVREVFLSDSDPERLIEKLETL